MFYKVFENKFQMNDEVSTPVCEQCLLNNIYVYVYVYSVISIIYKYMHTIL